MKKVDSTRAAALRLALVYAVLSCLWILFSDQAVHALFDEPAMLTATQSAKGWAFVLASSAVIYVLIRRELVRLSRARTDLDEQKTFLDAMMDHSPATMYVKDPEGRYLFANRRFRDLLDGHGRKIEGKTDQDFFPEAVAAKFRAHDVRVLESGRTCDFRERMMHADGSEHTYISVKFPLRDSHGAIWGVCGISSDITEREELDRKLEQHERLNAIGRLTGGVAHDFNNHLTVIRGNLELLKGDGAGAPDAGDCIRDALHASAQAARLIDRLLSFARKQMLVVEEVDVNAAVARMRDLLARSLGESVTLDVAPSGGGLHCLVDSAQLESALMNLAVNARDAMPGGGTLRIRTHRERVSPPRALRDGIEPGEYACIEVQDTGDGIPAETLERVLEPFFTTKEPGKGTGLGLSMVEGFARQSGGCTRIQSQPGDGTTVAILLPAVEPAGAKATANSGRVDALPRGDGERILVVEDQAPLREFAMKVLESHGYNVCAAGDGDGARRIMEEAPGLDLLFSDVVLPGGIMGHALAGEFAGRFPAGQVLLTSGYADRDNLADGEALARYPMLKKPYGLADLLHAIHGSLHSR